MPNCWRTPIPKFHVFMMPFHFVAGLRKFRLLVCYHKMSTTFFLFNIFEGFTWNKKIFFSLFKNETKEKVWKNINYFLDQNVFCPFLENKIKYLTTFNLEFYFLPHPTTYTPHPTTYTHHPSSLIPHTSSIFPHLTSLTSPLSPLLHFPQLSTLIPHP